jgi:hypothetical protein
MAPSFETCRADVGPTLRGFACSRSVLPLHGTLLGTSLADEVAPRHEGGDVGLDPVAGSVACGEEEPCLRTTR